MVSQRASQSQERAKLDFPEKLIQTGKKENTEALLRRLKTLHAKLAKLDQDGTDVRSLDPIRKPLVHPTILHHKDRGVKAYAACCLAEVLRLYAPDAPYTPSDVRDIFQFFTAQLVDNLKAPPPARPLQPTKGKQNEESLLPQASQRVTDVAYYSEYCSLLENLASIKSVVLATDVPGWEGLVKDFFEGFKDIARPDMSKTMIGWLVEILVVIIEECSSIPSSVMDCIIDTFAHPDGSPAFQLIVDVCNRASDRLYRPIFTHFAQIQNSHGRDPSPADLKVLADSHALLLSIYRYSPSLLMSVMPLLEENLRVADEVPLRQLSTRTLGTIFGERPIVGGLVADMAKAFPGAWRAWLGRKVDKALPVRLAWVETSRGILQKHPELRKEMEVELSDRILDADERVRAAICKVIGSLDVETAMHHISQQTLRAIGGRMSDKKLAVRQEAASGLGRLWSAAYGEIEVNNEYAIRQFAWIPGAMLSCLKTNSTAELRHQITRIFRGHILPLPRKAEDDQSWTDRLLLVTSRLIDGDNEDAFQALIGVAGLRGYAKGGAPWRSFIEHCEKNNGGVIDSDSDAKAIKERLAFIQAAIGQLLFSDSAKAQKDMDTFASANQQRLYKLFKTCADPQTDLNGLLKARNELLRKVEQSMSETLETFTTMTDAASFDIINKSMIPHMLKILQKPPSGAQGLAIADAAARILTVISKECPPMFKDFVPQLVIAMTDKNERPSEVALRALAAICKIDPKASPEDRRTLEKAMKLAFEGTPKQAKFATRFLAYSKHKDLCSELIEDILDKIEKTEDELLLTYLSAFSELALTAPTIFEVKSAEIIRFVIDEVMTKTSPSAGDSEDAWREEDDLLTLDRAKLFGMKVCSNRCLGYARDADAVSIFQPTLTLLMAILRNEGAVNENTAEGGVARSHMRLRASSCLLKLAKVRAFDRAMTNTFEEISYIIQDPIFQVRNSFLIKLKKVLPDQRLLPRWNVLPSLAAKDPESENVLFAKAIYPNIIKTCQHMSIENRLDRIELPLARLMLLLSHHPDFAWDPEGLKDIGSFICLYLDCVAHRDNIALLYLIAGKIKTVRDASFPTIEENENLYKLSELTQVIIKNRAARHQWTMSAYPGKVRLPKDIFHNLTDPEAVNRNIAKRYLSDETISWAKGLGSRALDTGGNARKPRSSSSPSKKRAKKPRTSASRKKARRSSVSDEEDESDEDMSEAEDEDGSEADERSRTQTAEDSGGEDTVMGRGGRRGAKTKAKKAVSKNTKSKKRRTGKAEGAGNESDLTDPEADD